MNTTTMYKIPEIFFNYIKYILILQKKYILFFLTLCKQNIDRVHFMRQQLNAWIYLSVTELKKCYHLMYSTILYHVKEELLLTKTRLFPIIDNIYLKILKYLHRLPFYDPLIYFNLAISFFVVK